MKTSRRVWSAAHGPIPTGMIVHHVNHDPTDNRLENLALMTPSEHQRHHAADRPPRPPAPARKKILLRLPDEMHDQLKARARAERRSLNAQLVTIIEQYLTGVERPRPPPTTRSKTEVTPRWKQRDKPKG